MGVQHTQHIREGARPYQDQAILAQDKDQQSLETAALSSVSTVLKCWVDYIRAKGNEMKRGIIKKL